MGATIDPDLAGRLQRLKEQDPTCCANDLRAVVEELRGRETYQRSLTIAKALSEPNRLTALALLAERGEMCACEIQAALDVTHATVSHHMDRLRTADLVDGEKRGTWVYYAPTGTGRRILERWSP